MEMVKMVKLPALVVVFLFTAAAAGSRNDNNLCLKDFSVMGATPESITVAWNYTCSDRHSVRFKVYYQHKGWNACVGDSRSDTSRPQGRGNVETEEFVYSFPSLHPYSLYSLSMKALATDLATSASVVPPEEAELIAETTQALPGVAPRNSVIQPRPDRTSLRFNWNSPTRQDCRDFNCDLDETTAYVLRGTDPWNQDASHRGSTTAHAMLFERLLPYSSYSLFLYSEDKRGRRNEDVFLRMEARTTPARPPPPSDLAETAASVQGSGVTRTLKWTAPYPPNGVLNYYTIRWKSGNSSVWEGRGDVFPETAGDLCDDEDGGGRSEGVVCHSVTGLKSGQDYVFQVSARNEGVPDPSSWSAELASLGSGRGGGDGGGGSAELSDSTFVVVVAIVSVVVVVLILAAGSALCFWCRQRRRDGKEYKNVPPYESTFPGNASMMTTSTSTAFSRAHGARTSFTSQLSTSTTDYSLMRRYQHHLLPLQERGSRPGSIQDQPLPAPPREDHLYEELRLKQDPAPGNGVTDRSRSRSGSGGGVDAAESDEDDFLKPTSPVAGASTSSNRGSKRDLARLDTTGSLDEGDYLPPRVRKASADTLDIDDYLKPTFDKFEFINPRDLSPPDEAPPPIPTVSYTPVNKGNKGGGVSEKGAGPQKGAGPNVKDASWE